MSRLRLGKIVGDPVKWLISTVQNVEKILDQSLSPADNFNEVVFRGTTPGVANTEFTLTHNLNRGAPRQDSAGNWIPGIEFVYWLNGAGTLYESNYATWTDNAIKLKCTDASRGYTIIIR